MPQTQPIPYHAFHHQLQSWYRAHHRDLPWRRTRDPYTIWLSEIILQQTRVQQGLPYFQKILKAFPRVDDLAIASEEHLMQLWKGLGYYRRARLMHQAAQRVVHEYGGRFPSSFEDLKKLPGVGDYTAAAIASMAFGEAVAVVDGNVVRVVSRLFDDDVPVHTSSGRRHFQHRAQNLLDDAAPGDHNQAMMELGATVCHPRQPQCTSCPVQSFCRAYAQGVVAQRPLKKPKVAVRDRYMHYLLLELEGCYAVRKRSDQDIWGGLFELVLCERQDDRPAQAGDFEAVLGVRPHHLNMVFSKRHKLTHQQLHCLFYTAKWPLSGTMGPSGYHWVDASELKQLATPVVIDHFLRRML